MPSIKQRLRKQQQQSISTMLALAKINECIGELITAIDNSDFVAQQQAAIEMGRATRLVANCFDAYYKASEEVITGGDILE